MVVSCVFLADSVNPTQSHQSNPLFGFLCSSAVPWLPMNSRETSAGEIFEVNGTNGEFPEPVSAMATVEDSPMQCSQSLTSVGNIW